MNYILNGHDTVKCDDLIEWAKWFEKADRCVANDVKDGVRVSTVFLGIDHSFGGDKPILFETMVFGGDHDGYTQRYSTWEEAEKWHSRVCDEVFPK